jgi:hypothetical protein
VVDDLGRNARAYRETDVEAADHDGQLDRQPTLRSA